MAYKQRATSPLPSADDCGYLRRQMGWNPPPEDKKMRAHIKVHPQGLHTPLREIIDERLDEQRSKEGPKAVNWIAVER